MRNVDIVYDIEFNNDITDEGEFVSCLYLKLPYYSPEDKGGTVYFRSDKELNRKMRDIREISSHDIKCLGNDLVGTYKQLRNIKKMENAELNTLVDILMTQNS